MSASAKDKILKLLEVTKESLTQDQILAPTVEHAKLNTRFDLRMEELYGNINIDLGFSIITGISKKSQDALSVYLRSTDEGCEDY